MASIYRRIAERETIDWKRYLGRDRRDFRRTVGESAVGSPTPLDSRAVTGLANLAAPEPTPEVVAELRDQLNHLLAKLPDDQRRIALQKLQSYINEEIAVLHDCVPRTIERKLQLIRESWADAK